MSRSVKTVDYEAARDLTVRLGDCRTPEHLACFVVDSVALLDLSALYARYGSRGGEPYAPEGLLALLLYGYATGVFRSRKIERATYEAIPFRFIAGNRHPDHDTIAVFRRTFLPDLTGLFVQVLLLAQEAGVLTLGTISLDGTKIHADASKSKAIRYKRLRELESHLRAEVEELFALAEQMDARDRPDGLVVRDEIARREDRLAQLAAAKVVIEERARERDALERAVYEDTLAQRAQQEQATGRRPRGRAPSPTGLGRITLSSRRPRGRAPSPPVPGPRAKDQDNFTDPDSRIMKNPTDHGFDQDCNAQVAVDQQSLLIVGTALSTHPNDTHGFWTVEHFPHGGRHRAAPMERRAEVEERLAHAPGEEARQGIAPTAEGPPPSRWTLRAVRASIPCLRGMSLSGVWRALRREGLGLRTARVRQHSPDPDYAAKQAHMRACLADAAAHPDTVVLRFLAEMGYRLWPDPALDWAPAAPTPVPVAERAGPSNTLWRIVGALNALTGQVHDRAAYIVGRRELIRFYRQLAAAYPHARRLYLVQDNWSIHTHPDVCAALAALPQLVPVWLPTYAPWLNPIEKLWR